MWSGLYLSLFLPFLPACFSCLVEGIDLEEFGHLAKQGSHSLGSDIHHLLDQFVSGLKCNFSLQFFSPTHLESEKAFIESAPCNLALSDSFSSLEGTEDRAQIWVNGFCDQSVHTCPINNANGIGLLSYEELIHKY